MKNQINSLFLSKTKVRKMAAMPLTLFAIMFFFLMDNKVFAQAATSSPFDIVSIIPTSDITVPVGTPYPSIGLPTSTIATLGNSSTINLPILWDRGTPFYTPTVPGIYAFNGNLFLLGNTTNSGNIKASLNVDVSSSMATSTGPSPFDIISTTPTPDIVVAVGTPYSSIGLPTSTVATLRNSETITLPILWDFGTPFYSPNVPGTYAFNGTLFLLGDITNPNTLKASLNVTISSSIATSTGSSGSPQATTTTTSTDNSNNSNTPTTSTETPTVTAPATSHSSSSGIGGHRKNISGLLSLSQGQVLGVSTSAGSDVQQQLFLIIQQLMAILQRYSSNLSSNS